MRVVFTIMGLVALAVHGSAGDKTPSKSGDALQGEWLSWFSRSPDSPDALIQRTLQIGLKGKPEAVRLSWSMFCGRSRITGGDSYVGRLISVEHKGKNGRLVFAGDKDTRYEVEFELTEDALGLKGTIKGVDVSDGWTRKRVAVK